MNIKLSSLPLSIFNKIPLSIKSYKDVYDIDELPYEIQKLIKESSYSSEQPLIYVDKIYDFDFVISQYGDFNTISNLRSLVVNYMTNYLQLCMGDYPFNGEIGSNVKRLLNTRDSTIRKLYMTEELDNMIKSFGNNIDNNISVSSFNIDSKNSSYGIEYNLNIVLNINDISTNINSSFIL